MVRRGARLSASVSAVASFSRMQWLMVVVVFLALFSFALIFRYTFYYSSSQPDRYTPDAVVVGEKFTQPPPSTVITRPRSSARPLSFMKSKLVLLVSHELSLSGGPLLLMELAFLLQDVGAVVCWVTNHRPTDTDYVLYSLEQKMVYRGIQVMSSKGQEVVNTALRANLVVLNTAVAGKWLDSVLKEKVPLVLPKTLWWIHEIRGRYFSLDYVNHLPFVAGAMIDSHVAAEYWKNRTQEQLRFKMPKTYVVHLGNSKELMEVAEDSVARNVLREHVRESLRVQREDILFAVINSVSRGKGQDLFLQSFHKSLLQIKRQKIQVPSIHAVIVGSDINVQTKFESNLRAFVESKHIQGYVHFVNKTLAVAPYLAAINVLVQNSQEPGECFGRITIEGMAFHLPVLGTAAGGTLEIVENGTTGILHPVGKAGVLPLARNMVELATDVVKRVKMGNEGYVRVKERFTARHMEKRIASVLNDVLRTVRIRQIVTDHLYQSWLP